ncbi:MAG: hypothetical protein EA350_10015 [Gemmatimonadales bacterium]|nr:MAG: hypothetical protein EA350_10015 [Gemmatimonadales bacterium]
MKAADGPPQESAGELADEASRVADELRDEAEERADRWTGQMGRRGTGLAKALEAASSSLREDGDRQLAELAERAAGQVERMAGYLERENPGAFMDDLEDLGRSNPAAFLGTAFAAGVLSGRLFRASAPENGGNGTSTASSRGSGTGSGNGHDRQGTWDGGHQAGDHGSSTPLESRGSDG